VADGHELVLTTTGGETVEGYCLSIDVNGIRVTAKDGRVVQIARKTLSRLDMRRTKSHQLRALRKDIRGALKVNFDYLFSPMAPIGLAGLPGTLAWGAVATPFCALGDLRAKLTGTRQIKMTQVTHSDSGAGGL